MVTACRLTLLTIEYRWILGRVLRIGVHDVLVIYKSESLLAVCCVVRGSM